MSINAILALTLLVLIAGGFYVGRSRAMTASRGQIANLHSLPNYYGYFVATWTGLPAIIVLLMNAFFGQQLADRLTTAQLTSAARDMVSAYSVQLEDDASYQALLAAAAQQRSVADQLRSDINTLRRARGEARDPARLDTLRQDRLDRVNLLTATETSLENRRQQIASELLAAADAETSDTARQSQAGFILATASASEAELFVTDMRRIADGDLPSRDTPVLHSAAQLLVQTENGMMRILSVIVLALALGGFLVARQNVGSEFRARNNVEYLINTGLFLCSVIAILTTVGIVASLMFESVRFFSEVPLQEFLFGLQWSPQIAIRADQVGQSGAFGAVPLFAGTALITLIAMVVAIPIGLFAAIYLSEYAGPRFRQIAKPALEILAGIPTVVYGFFALLTVGPFIRGLFGALGFEDVVTQSALSAGLVMGVMIIPFISSLSDDVINSVPQSLRDGSYAMGATQSETIRQVVLPAALPGIVGAVLLAVSRAVGETMIVVMAAGQGANLTANPLEAVTTITVQIVMLLTGDQEFNSVKTLSAFALGLVLFIITLIMNIIALRVVQKYREKYD